MINKEIDKIAEKDLQGLVENAVGESKTIEYKRQLNINSDKDKKEFLADVSSFANASGGDLIFGIVESKGIPTEIRGMDVNDVDSEKLKLDSIIQDGIEPRLPSVQIQSIRLANQKTVLIIRVGKSWLSPHRVTFKHHDKFYTRNSCGKYPMDVSELRTAFTLADTLSEKIKKFKESRLASIIADETPIPIQKTPKIVLHLIPFISFTPGQRYDLKEIFSRSISIHPIHSAGWSHRYNLDGLLIFSDRANGTVGSYTQLYYNGIIEAVDSSILTILKPRLKKDLIPSVTFEEKIIKALKEYSEVLSALEVEPPILVFLTMIGVKGYQMVDSGYNQMAYLQNRPEYEVDRDILQIPEVIIEDYKIKPGKALKPIFDAAWSACGFERSLNYNENGEWKPKGYIPKL
jgi:hypothetical protein